MERGWQDRCIPSWTAALKFQQFSSKNNSKFSDCFSTLGQEEYNNFKFKGLWHPCIHTFKSQAGELKNQKLPTFMIIPVGKKSAHSLTCSCMIAA